MVNKIDNQESNPYFTPISQEAYPKQCPESISYSEHAKALKKQSKSDTKNTKPRKKISVLYLLIGIVAAITFLEGAHIFKSITSNASFYSYGFSFVYITLSVVLLIWLIKMKLNQKQFFYVERLQGQVKELSLSSGYNESQAYIDKLKTLYYKKTQHNQLIKAINSVPDYANNKEVIAHIEQHFFSILDQQALKKISLYSQQTALIVTISPLAILDMLFALWRCNKMIDEISIIYGLNNSMITHYQLIKKILYQLIFIGSSDFITDQLATLATSEALVKITSNGAQGLGAGLYNARIGLQAMALCRPMGFSQAHRPTLLGILQQIKAGLKKQ